MEQWFAKYDVSPNLVFQLSFHKIWQWIVRRSRYKPFQKPLVEFDSFKDFEFMNHESAEAKTRAFKTMSLKQAPFAISTITHLIRIDWKKTLHDIHSSGRNLEAERTPRYPLNKLIKCANFLIQKIERQLKICCNLINPYFIRNAFQNICCYFDSSLLCIIMLLKLVFINFHPVYML